MGAATAQTGTGGQVISLPGVVAAVIGLAGLVLPFVQFRANRIVAGEGLHLPDVLGGTGAAVLAGLAAVFVLAALRGVRPALRLAVAVAALTALTLTLGQAATMLSDGGAIARVSPAAGYWVLTLALGLIAADGAAQMRLRPPAHWLLLAVTVAAAAALIGSGVLDDVSVMREYAARADQFWREGARHLILAFASLGAALVVGLPLGIVVYTVPGLRGAVLGALDFIQTIPSLALFGLMIPLFGWVAANVPGAAGAGIAGIGAFPALVALFLYSLLPVVSNMVVGLDSIPASIREAATGLGMTRTQALRRVMIPLTLPVVLAAVRIVLVQNIGLAVIAGLIGGGGFGSFVFQGLNQTAMDLILLGALPTIALALVSSIALDIALVQLKRPEAA
ncbi:MAG: ABC transporter permease [Paracoccus sp. (in: a-proteobacteria)]|uniref:ABC transporter permease n=1 Tax=Paracoccus sp. TaxID=267 RepID=UPI0026DF0229|nr:ABC transporter permease [Paracoccus sp. (in: a-proteobacteria)]MDO5620663.1 ABC transporter permease [Paracoccus sp. (in: a-proteobacteria)]